MKLLLTTLMTVLTISVGWAQVVNQLVERALEQNQDLKAMEFSFAQSMAKLGEARGYFFPSVTLTSRYSRAGGGRTIDFPVGDLLNPVYSSLNTLTGTTQFPQIENVSTRFLREQEQETKVSVVQPLFNPMVWYQYQVRDAEQQSVEAQKNSFKRQLIFEVKQAYYQYLSADARVHLLNQTKELVIEQMRVTRALYANDKVLQSAVLRAETDLADIDQQLESAIQQRTVAMAYVNHLIHEPLASPVEMSDPILPSNLPAPTITASMVDNRYEFKQLKAALDATDHAVTLSTSAYIPNLVLALDYGYQGEFYRFTEKDDYWMASLVLSWNLFEGTQNYYKREQAIAQNRQVQSQIQSLRTKLEMEMIQVAGDLSVSTKNYEKSQKQVEAARSYFTQVSKAFEVGIATQLEFLDARNRLTQSELNTIITRTQVLIQQANWDRITTF